MVQSKLLQETNKNKIGEQLVRNNTQIESAMKNLVLLMNEVKDIHTNNPQDVEITDALVHKNNKVLRFYLISLLN